MKMKKGYTLVELLVVIVVFSVVSMVATQTIVAILRGAKKSEGVTKVRQNLDYAMGTMERQLRQAKGITSSCNGTATSSITFNDQFGNPVTFSCVGINNGNQPASIASSSASLTGNDITLSACSFTCTAGSASSPSYVTMTATGAHIAGQSQRVTVTTQVTLRSY